MERLIRGGGGIIRRDDGESLEVDVAVGDELVIEREELIVAVEDDVDALDDNDDGLVSLGGEEYSHELFIFISRVLVCSGLRPRWTVSEAVTYPRQNQGTIPPS